MSSDPVINEDTHYARVECPHCKNTHNVKLAKEEKVIDPIQLSDALCGCAIHTDNSVRFIDFVFDGPPGPYGPRLVEVENQFGQSINLGKWTQRKDGMWVLRLPFPDQNNHYRMQLVQEFEKHLTGDAKRIYNTPLKNTLAQTLKCMTCGGVEFLPTKAEEVVYSGMVNLLNQLTDPKAKEDLAELVTPAGISLEKARAMPHFGHEFQMHVYPVQFMSQSFEVSMAASMAFPEMVYQAFAQRAEWMAKEFNKGVQNGWLKWGTLLQCHVVPLALHSPSYKYTMCVFVASDKSHKELNELYGKDYFMLEGQLAPLGIWPEPTFER